MTFSVSAAATSACSPANPHPKAAKTLLAAACLLTSLERGHALDAHLLREAMTAVFAISDQDGAWVRKDAYEASEAAAVLFLRRYAQGMLKKTRPPARYLAMMERLSSGAGTVLSSATLPLSSLWHSSAGTSK